MPADRGAKNERREGKLRRWLRDEQGVATVEYALLLALLAVASVGAWMGLSSKIKLTLATATNAISQPLN